MIQCKNCLSNTRDYQIKLSLVRTAVSNSYDQAISLRAMLQAFLGV